MDLFIHGPDKGLLICLDILETPHSWSKNKKGSTNLEDFTENSSKLIYVNIILFNRVQLYYYSI